MGKLSKRAKRQVNKRRSPRLPPRPCAGIGTGGGRCKKAAMKGSEFCFFHDPDKKEQVKAIQSAGGKASTKPKTLPPETPDVKIETLEDVGKEADILFSQFRRGDVDRATAETEVKILALRTKTLPAPLARVDLQSSDGSMSNLESRKIVLEMLREKHAALKREKADEPSEK